MGEDTSEDEGVFENAKYFLPDDLISDSNSYSFGEVEARATGRPQTLSISSHFDDVVTPYYDYEDSVGLSFGTNETEIDEANRGRNEVVANSELRATAETYIPKRSVNTGVGFAPQPGLKEPQGFAAKWLNETLQNWTRSSSPPYFGSQSNSIGGFPTVEVGINEPSTGDRTHLRWTPPEEQHNQPFPQPYLSDVLWNEKRSATGFLAKSTPVAEPPRQANQPAYLSQSASATLPPWKISKKIVSKKRSNSSTQPYSVAEQGDVVQADTSWKPSVVAVKEQPSLTKPLTQPPVHVTPSLQVKEDFVKSSLVQKNPESPRNDVEEEPTLQTVAPIPLPQETGIQKADIKGPVVPVPETRPNTDVQPRQKSFSTAEVESSLSSASTRLEPKATRQGRKSSAGKALKRMKKPLIKQPKKQDEQSKLQPRRKEGKGSSTKGRSRRSRSERKVESSWQEFSKTKIDTLTSFFTVPRLSIASMLRGAWLRLIGLVAVISYCVQLPIRLQIEAVRLVLAETLVLLCYMAFYVYPIICKYPQSLLYQGLIFHEPKATSDNFSYVFNSWITTLVWYLMHVQIFCTGPGIRARVFRVLLPVACTFQLFNEISVLAHMNGAELLLVSYFVLLLKTLNGINILVLSSTAMQIGASVMYGNHPLVQWVVFVTQAITYKWLGGFD